MTNMRKRHVYPVLAGKKHPKSALEMAILERHKQATPFLSESHAGTNADSSDSDIDICAARCSRTEAASTVKNEGNTYASTCCCVYVLWIHILTK